MILKGGRKTSGARGEMSCEAIVRMLREVVLEEVGVDPCKEVCGEVLRRS